MDLQIHMLILLAHDFRPMEIQLRSLGITLVANRGIMIAQGSNFFLQTFEVTLDLLTKGSQIRLERGE